MRYAVGNGVALTLVSVLADTSAHTYTPSPQDRHYLAFDAPGPNVPPPVPERESKFQERLKKDWLVGSSSTDLQITTWSNVPQRGVMER